MCDDEVPVDLVCITGDVANWGLADEYPEATELITRTARLADVPMDRVFIVPGNHDICRTTNKAEWEQMIDTLSRNRDEAGFSNWMDGTSGTPPLGFDPTWRDAVLARQHDYRAWVREALQRPDLLPGSHANLGYRVELVVGGVPVHVIGLDSAWLSGGEADAGRLRLTEGQVNFLATDPQTGDVLPGFKLALIHHPLSALADGSARRRDLADRVHLLLRGHQHEQELEVSADPDRRLQTFSAGSLYEGDIGNYSPNGCLLIDVTLDAQGEPERYELRFRGWSDRQFWFDDPSLYERAKGGRYSISTKAQASSGAASAPSVAMATHSVVNKKAPPVADPLPSAQAPPPKTPSPQEIAKESLPSVLLIVVRDKQAQPLAMGSGFVVKPGVVATNFHVIDGASSAHATVTDSDKPLAIDGILATDADQDLALLKVSGLGAPPLTMETSADPEIGDRVYAVGKPKGLRGTVSEGIVSAKRNVKARTLLQITAPISPGSSGGPVLNKDGRVIGVATATLKDGQNLNFAVGVTSLAKLMKEISDDAKPFPGPSRKKAALPEGNALGSAVSFADFMWDKEYDFQGGTYTVTIRNKLNRPIKDVIALVVFYDSAHFPLETSTLKFDEFIPSGLARMARGGVDGMIKVRVSKEIKSGTAYSRRPIPGRVELRLLDFQFAD
jgi:S1-C subfamily serine protease/predicted phosphodiesterase